MVSSFLKIIFVVCSLVSFITLEAHGFSFPGDGDVAIEKLLYQTDKFGTNKIGPDYLHLEGETVYFYQQRNFSPAWLEGKKLSRNAEIFLEFLRGSFEEGFCPEDYHLRKIEKLIALNRFGKKQWDLYNSAWLGQLDILLTDAFMLYASDFINGRVHPLEVNNRWRFNKNRPDMAKFLRFALEQQQVPQVLKKIKPSFPEYWQLVAGLKKYRELAAKGGWERLPAGPSLRLGDRDPRIFLLRDRLAVTGELVGLIEQSSDLFDTSLRTALIRFQRRHGLVEDGVLGAKTLEELNVSAEERVRQIEVNLERLRWLPKSLGKRHLIINIPDLQLTVFENEQPVMWMPVIVGKSYRKTPVFSARMTYLEFSPYWHVPPTILKEDKLPKIKKDPGWLLRNNYEIIPWRGGNSNPLNPFEINWKKVKPDKFPGMLRQKPGPWNPLGGVKFMFPNPYAVYLHDTNERHLFSRNIRLFSSGCIRIERPLDLAKYLLGKKGWSCETLYRLMHLKKPKRVNLARTLPVYIFYMTAWVDREGIVQFRKDIYLKDRVLEQLLSNRIPNSISKADKQDTRGSVEGEKLKQVFQPVKRDQGAEYGTQG
jgi:murein L,D-transpeptidase YcbB/YkuD